MKKNKEVSVFNGCAPTLALAVGVFNDSWTPDSSKTRTIKLLEKVIAAWHSVILTLPDGHFGKEVFHDLSLDQLARTGRFLELENMIIDRHQKYCSGKHNADITFGATVDTLRGLVFRCRAVRATFSSGAPVRLHHKFCEFCGDPTEYAALLPALSRDAYDPDLDGGPVRPSVNYCQRHRPKFAEDRRNSLYLSMSRRQSQFNKELSNLQKRSVSMSHVAITDTDVLVDRFYLNLLARDAIYPDEVSRLRQEARQLADAHVDDRKKRTVMLRAAGWSLAAIAHAIGANSRQSVSQLLALIPPKYRFDLQKNVDLCSVDFFMRSDETETLREHADELVYCALTEVLLRALKDPNIVEVYLNANGSLRAELRVGGRCVVGEMSATEAEELILAVAKRSDDGAGSGKSIVEGDLPFLHARFIGFLPPTVAAPIFGIRKKATGSIVETNK